MALDGAFLCALRRELSSALEGARVDKIHQPSREELVLWMRTPAGTKKLYISVRGSSPRVHLTERTPENPASPPMFCMLLRKHLTGGRFSEIRQDGFERAVYMDFACVNELGDPVTLTLAIELMGRGSNLLLLGQNGRIIDAVHRVELGTTARPILPEMPYEPPPVLAGKWDVSSVSAERIKEQLRCTPNEELSSALLRVTRGLSPLLCREIAVQTVGNTDTFVGELSSEQWTVCISRLERVVRVAEGGEPVRPYLIYTAEGTPWEFSFLPITQYGLSATGKDFSSLSALLEAFYGEKDEAERRRQRAQDVRRAVKTAQERTARKLERQREELARSADRETYRRYGELLNASLGGVVQGATYAEVVDYYDPECALVRIPLDPSKTPSQNAQRYYKEYRKAQTAERVLSEQIAAGEEELLYLESVADAAERAQTSRELEEIRNELFESGYLRRQKKKQKQKLPPAEGPLRFVSGDGFTILVGRNNLQNDMLTLKTARGGDLWFHTKNVSGSHTILVTEGKTPPERTLREAAMLAAWHSKAANSAQVPVDFTAVRYVKKPSGARPGRVIYEHQQTVYVTPDKTLCEALKDMGK